MTKLVALPADASPTLDDLVYMINAPGTVPVDRKVTGTALATMLAAAPAFTGAFVAAVDLSSHLAGDGFTDDAAALIALIAASPAGSTFWSPTATTYLLGSAVVVNKAIHWEMNGATFKKKSTHTGWAFDVTATGVAMRELIVDGNRSAGATGGGIRWSGASGKAVDCESSHTKTQGWHVHGAGDLKAVRCVGNDNVSASNAGDGFFCWDGGRLRTWDCQADDNDRSGFYLATGTSAPADGCRISGSADRNWRSGATIRSGAKGEVPYFTGAENRGFGLTVERSVTGWTFGVVSTSDTGVDVNGWGVNNSGTAVELYGATHCHFGSVISRGMLGYGLALATDNSAAPTGLGCTYNDFGVVIVDSTEGGNIDPAVHFSGASKHNSIGVVSVTAASIALIFGEGTTGNDFNVVGQVTAERVSYLPVKIDGGAHNQIGRVVAIDCFNADVGGIGEGIIDFQGATTHDNIVSFVDVVNDAGPSAPMPGCIIHADADAAGNIVQDGVARDFAGDEAFVDVNGGNRASLRTARLVVQVATADSGETWTNSTNNTTGGQFVEGTGGKKIVGAPGYTSSQRTYGGSQDFSETGESGWLRLWVYITNASDFGSADDALSIRFVAPAGGSNYFQKAWPAEQLVDGGQWLWARKGDFTTAGTVAWSAILSHRVLVYGATSVSTVTVDDISWVSFDQPAAPTAPSFARPPVDGDFSGAATDGLMAIDSAASKIYVRVGGTWKSVTVA